LTFLLMCQTPTDYKEISPLLLEVDPLQDEFRRCSLALDEHPCLCEES
jgi:hypothetical protein